GASEGLPVVGPILENAGISRGPSFPAGIPVSPVPFRPHDAYMMHTRRRPPIFAKLFVTAGLLLFGLAAGRPAYGQLEPRSAERDFAEAYKLFADRLYHEAVTAFADFRAAHPDHVHAAD